MQSVLSSIQQSLKAYHLMYTQAVYEPTIFCLEADTMTTTYDNLPGQKKFLKFW
jgi:hypothetical protein